MLTRTRMGLATLGLIALAGCGSPESKLAFNSADAPAIWGIAAPTSSFPPGGAIPAKYAAPSDISPPLAWKCYVSPVVEYVVFVEDIDAKDTPAVNWIVYGIPTDTQKLDEGAAATGKLTQGRNYKGTIGYAGPDPDSDSVHHYAFEVFALYKPLGLEAGADKQAVIAAMTGKVVAKSRMAGIYHRGDK